MPSFLDNYKSWCSKNKVPPDVVDIPNTTNNIKGFWIGSKSTAKYTMIYYHGGGFVFPGGPPHVAMLFNFVKWSNNNLAIFCVGYTLSPEAVYPTALSQCVEALRYILDQPGHSPSNTLLGGDSAGGNLVLAVLSHVSEHPHPRSDLVRPLSVSGNLKAALVIAPWTSSDSKLYPSMDKFANRDFVNSICANYWIDAYKGSGKNVPNDEYICAALASPDWWKGTKCDQIFATAGEEEVLLDAITDWETKFAKGAGNDKIKYVIGKRETHDTPLNCMAEKKLIELGEKSQEGAIRLWIKETLA